LPEISPDDLDLTTSFLGHTLQAPLIIAGMTGGSAEALELNRSLAIAANALGVAIGTGSQRAAIRNPALIPTYAVVRQHAPDTVVVGNLGMCQLIDQPGESGFGPADIEAAIEMIEADVLAIHLNAVEELIQPEGDRHMRGVAAAIKECVKRSGVPVIAKETGAGVTRETAITLAGLGVAGIDVGGVGGTSFARIEGIRAQEIGDERGERLGRVFQKWGLTTVLSILESRSVGVPLIATGGIRSGLHAAKALALGASLVGVGSPAIRAAEHGPDAVINEISLIIEELRTAMTLIGAPTIEKLQAHRPVLLGSVAEWVQARGLE
jgi:isopentenyl-diphosphate delta-isomerase